MELFRQAATIMVLGMGLVFLFLAAVILCVMGVARLVRRYEEQAVSGGEGGKGGEDGRKLAAAIAVALGQRR